MDQIQEHTVRIRKIERAVIYMPQISPEGMPGERTREAFQGGQIGVLDEGFNYDSHPLIGNDNSITISSCTRTFISISSLVGGWGTSSAPYERFTVVFWWQVKM